MNTLKSGAEESSFRDPGGFLFWEEGNIFRQINAEYKENYDCLISSGLYKRLTEENLLIPHTEVSSEKAGISSAYKIIKPEMLDFITYPYEWSFSQLKDAALTTINIQKIALEYGMSLKDSSAYNIQFMDGRPILIDTLSFEKYEEGKPWIAYRQFCQHFLAPLALMSYKDIRLSQLLKVYIDGIPLDLASSLLPWRTRFKFSTLMHIHLHAGSQKSFSDRKVNVKNIKMSRFGLTAMIDSLENAVRNIRWKPKGTEWGDYYSITNYSEESFYDKKKLVEEFLTKIDSKTVWDLGANTGVFSRIASEKGIKTIAFDIDPAAVEKNYLHTKEKSEQNILPMLIDLTNPSPSIGWDNQERMSLKERKHPDTVFALALIHHLVISNNLPFYRIAGFFNSICENLIIEFVPKSDSQVQKLLAAREDIFVEYTKEDFEKVFGEYFSIERCECAGQSERFLYLMKAILKF